MHWLTRDVSKADRNDRHGNSGCCPEIVRMKWFMMLVRSKNCQTPPSMIVTCTVEIAYVVESVHVEQWQSCAVPDHLRNQHECHYWHLLLYQLSKCVRQMFWKMGQRLRKREIEFFKKMFGEKISHHLQTKLLHLVFYLMDCIQKRMVSTCFLEASLCSASILICSGHWRPFILLIEHCISRTLFLISLQS